MAPSQGRGRVVGVSRGCPMAVPKISFIQINLHKNKEAASLLTSRLVLEQTGVALVQEPGLRNKRVVSGLHNSGTVFQQADAPVRTCVVVRGLDAELVPTHTSRDLTTVKVKYRTKDGGLKELLVVSAYFHGLQEVPSVEFRALMEDESLRGMDLIIGCDSNSHHLLWGSESTDARGLDLVEALDHYGLDVVNRGSVPTFSTGRGETVIDITICSLPVSRDIRNWHVSKDVTMSDHRYVKFWLEGRALRPRYLRNPRKTNWEKYQELLKEKISNISLDLSSPACVNSTVTCVERTIISSYELSCPARKRAEKPGDPWWDNHLAELRNKVRKLYRNQKKDANAHRASYLSALASYKKEVKKKRVKSWKDFCGEIEGVTGSARLLKVLSKDGTYASGWAQRPDGEYPKNSRENLELLMKAHFPDFERKYPRSLLSCSAAMGPNDWATAQRVVSKGRVPWAIGSFAPYKSPGPDGIYPALLQRGLVALEAPLTKIFRACIAYGCIPVSWRRSRVAFIPKGGRVGHSVPKDYRPISLMSFVVKTLERLIDRHMEESLLMNPLSDAQHAYRKGRSTETALHRVVEYVEKGITQRGMVMATFIDIVGAFNCTPYKAIESGALAHGIHGTIVRWLKELLSKRLVHSEQGFSRIKGQVTQGCPQGGVLSPKLWCLAVDGLLEELRRAEFEVVGYSDDIAILVRGTRVDSGMEKMQEALLIVENWCRRVGLTVNPDKTECVLFTRKQKRTISGICGPTFYGKTLDLAENVKYLGVVLDRRLKWGAQMEHAAKKFASGYWLCRRALGTTWGLRPWLVKWIYQAILLPRLTYGSLVWWTRSNLVTAKGLMRRQQAMVLRSITGSTRTAPIAAMRVAAGVAPLDVEVKRAAARTAARLKVLGLWGEVRRDHGAIIGFRCIRDAHEVSDRILEETIFEKRFTVTLTLRDEWTDGTHPVLRGSKTFYTDGSKQNGNTGSGVWMSDSGRTLIGSAGPAATVFQSEILAIKMCSEDLLRRNARRQKLCICSDSWAALCALEAVLVSSRLVSEAKRSLNALGRENLVRLVWVPAHVGIPGNEMADSLAKKGTLLEERTDTVGRPWCDVVKSIADWAMSEGQTVWANVEGCRQSKAALGLDARFKYHKELLSLPRKECAAVMGWMTGHCHFNSHLRPPSTERRSCRFCDSEVESTEHILRMCPAVEERRVRYLGYSLMDYPDLEDPIRPTDLVRFLKALGLLGIGDDGGTQPHQ